MQAQQDQQSLQAITMCAPAKGNQWSKEGSNTDWLVANFAED